MIGNIAKAVGLISALIMFILIIHGHIFWPCMCGAVCLTCVIIAAIDGSEMDNDDNFER